MLISYDWWIFLWNLLQLIPGITRCRREIVWRIHLLKIPLPGRTAGGDRHNNPVTGQCAGNCRAKFPEAGSFANSARSKIPPPGRFARANRSRFPGLGKPARVVGSNFPGLGEPAHNAGNDFPAPGKPHPPHGRMFKFSRLAVLATGIIFWNTHGQYGWCAIAFKQNIL